MCTLTDDILNCMQIRPRTCLVCHQSLFTQMVHVPSIALYVSVFLVPFWWLGVDDVERTYHKWTLSIMFVIGLAAYVMHQVLRQVDDSMIGDICDIVVNCSLVLPYGVMLCLCMNPDAFKIVFKSFDFKIKIMSVHSLSLSIWPCITNTANLPVIAIQIRDHVVCALPLSSSVIFECILSVVV